MPLIRLKGYEELLDAAYWSRVIEWPQLWSITSTYAKPCTTHTYTHTHLHSHTHNDFVAICLQVGNGRDGFGPYQANDASLPPQLATVVNPNLWQFELANNNWSSGWLSSDVSFNEVFRVFNQQTTLKFWQDEMSIQLIVQEVPEQPKNLRINSQQSRSLQLTWSQPFAGNSPIEQYHIYYKQISGKPPQRISLSGFRSIVKSLI